MKKHKTQQFAKFFLKDLKNKNHKYEYDKLDLDGFIYSSSK